MNNKNNITMDTVLIINIYFLAIPNWNYEVSLYGFYMSNLLMKREVCISASVTLMFNLWKPSIRRETEIEIYVITVLMT